MTDSIVSKAAVRILPKSRNPGPQVPKESRTAPKAKAAAMVAPMLSLLVGYPRGPYSGASQSRAILAPWPSTPPAIVIEGPASARVS